MSFVLGCAYVLYATGVAVWCLRQHAPILALLCLACAVLGVVQTVADWRRS